MSFLNLVPWTLIAQWFNIALLIALIVGFIRFAGLLIKALEKYTKG